MLTELITTESLAVQASVTQQAFETLAEIPVAPTEAAGEWHMRPSIFGASVRYLGECIGSVRLECSPQLAFAFTRRLIAGAEPVALDYDVKDAIGELVNTIGGNLKGLLPSGVRLTTPKVSAEGAYDASACDCLSCINFDSEFGPLRLLIISADSKKEW